MNSDVDDAEEELRTPKGANPLFRMFWPMPRTALLPPKGDWGTAGTKAATLSTRPAWEASHRLADIHSVVDLIVSLFTMCSPLVVACVSNKEDVSLLTIESQNHKCWRRRK